jgi:hypothetical protein
MHYIEQDGRYTSSICRYIKMANEFSYFGTNVAVDPGGVLVVDGRRVDGRSTLARRYREIVTDLIEQATEGRAEDATPAQTIVIRRVAALVVLAEMWDVRILSGEAVDLREAAMASQAATKMLGALGLLKPTTDRASRAKNVGPDSHLTALREDAE